MEETLCDYLLEKKNIYKKKKKIVVEVSHTFY